jgi:ATP-binding cassette, subfamily C, bacterial CydC
MFWSDPLIVTLALLRPRARRLLMAIALGALSLGSGLALAGLSAWLITRAWQMPPVLDLTVAVVAVRALGISRGVLHYCERLASHDTALRAAASAREHVYARLADDPIGTAMRLHSGELVARVGSDVDELADVLVRAALPIGVAAVLSVAAAAVTGAISPAAGAVLAACLVVAGIVGPWLAARASNAEEIVAAQHHSARDVAAMAALEHAPELRVGGRLDDVITESLCHQRDWGYTADRAAAPAAVAAAVPVAAIGVSVVGAVTAGIGLAGSVAPTTLAVLMLLPLSAFEAITALPSAAVTLARARHAARRLVELTDPAEPTLRPRPLSARINLRPGARISITGPSGSGKTTLLIDLARTRSDIGFFAEDAHLFATTVRDNLLVARGDCDDDELRDALQRVGLGTWLASLPDGLSTVLTGGADAVSAGQRRRLLLARALISQFPIVLLDEPTEHLDAADGASMLRELLDPVAGLFNTDRTVVVATHHLAGAGRYIDIHD